MATKLNPPIASLEDLTGERKSRLPNGTRKHIRRLKEMGNYKEATLVKNAAIEQKNNVHPQSK